MTTLKTSALVFCLAFLCSGNRLFAQISDDFSDGNFSENPSWQGDITEFSINAAGELQLNAPDAGSSVLAVSGVIPDSAVWLLTVRLEFAPSATNLLRVYLMADQADLPGANGYYLEIGENGSVDAIRFYRQDGAARLLLATGMAGFVANEPVNIRLRIKRTATADWTIEAAAGNGAFQMQGAANDAVYTTGPGRFFGLYCLYTATRKDKFYFDNLSILPDVPDLTPPVLLSAMAENAITVRVSFDEALDSLTALDPAHYTIQGVGQPASVIFVAGGRQEVALGLSAALNTGNYTLEANQLADTFGNVSGLQTATFQFVQVEAAAEFDLLINEIMADPSPSAGLPETEWLELFNRSSKVIDLGTLFISDGGTPQSLPAHLLYPDSFVVLSSSAGASQLSGTVHNVLPVPGFPALNNDSDPLTLSDAGGLVVDQVNYSISWHTEVSKRDGGWTLERINPNNPCLGSENWQSCPAPPGGTPGRENASYSAQPDTKAPELLAVFPESSTSMRAVFSEGLDETTAENITSYQLTPARNIASAQLSHSNRSEVLIMLADPLQNGIIYTFGVTPVLTDCSGNPAPSAGSIQIGLPEKPMPMDIVINEVLFNPATGGSDYVELYNRSNKIFSWPGFSLANLAGGSDIEVIDLNRLFLPGEYAVFSANPNDIESRFTNVQPAHLFEMPLPSLPDDAGNITLLWSAGGTFVTVDSFDYSDDYHNALLSSSEKEGVALERIRPEGATNDPANWTSAARSAFGAAGTPTLPNSQGSTPGNPSADDLILVEPARLSPDGDGYEDFLDIRYLLPGSGYAATMAIYDSDGIPVRRLLRQELIGTSGALRWDGDMDNGTLARPGIYILFLEIFTPDGQIKRVKKTFAVVQRM